MKKRPCSKVLVLALMTMSLGACAAKEQVPKTGCPSTEGDVPVRPPAVAGAFYPGDPAELGAMVDSMLAGARIPELKGRVRALIAPHAGYVYSGSVAAHTFKAIEGAQFKTVVLVGASHREGYPGISVYSRGQFRTPLGDVPIDAEFAQKLIAASPLIYFRESAHVAEHSLEVQLPFLQRVLGDFKLVPVLLGDRAPELSRVLADALVATAGEDVLVIASTDLSHYPAYDDANVADRQTLQAVVSGDADALDRTIRQLEHMRIPDMATLMCGEAATKAVMMYAKAVGANRIELLKYANSGDAMPGGRKGVVGYGAVVFLEEGDTPGKEKAVEEEKRLLGDEEREVLLKLARDTVETYVKTGKAPEFKNTIPVLEQPLGAFVTIRKNGQLRGCIGRFEPDLPLYRVVMEMAIAAATQDHRFPRVTEAELGQLGYEISVLSPLQRVKSWREIRYGRHGVQVSKGLRRGVFLPQVAEETGWNFETFMDNLCAGKAGLPRDAWKDPSTQLQVFTAEVFHEE
ncbi:MAG: hypothetical protein BWY59_00391 [Verrucomicrobia bacterium ADurb.Bin345]|nr:MAG: hypothetical protein BWY59_00391 [Verrucomicrobia bacterium ADurb.Bin345]